MLNFTDETKQYILNPLKAVPTKTNKFFNIKVYLLLCYLNIELQKFVAFRNSRIIIKRENSVKEPFLYRKDNIQIWYEKDICLYCKVISASAEPLLKGQRTTSSLRSPVCFPNLSNLSFPFFKLCTFKC